MSYQKKTRFGQYIAVGDDDPWAEAASGDLKPVTGGAASASSGGFLDFLFKPAAPAAPAAPATPSKTSQVGAGIAAFLSTLGKPAVPTVPAGMPVTTYRPGMSTTTKLALAGGGALVLVLLLTRD